jgi:hypothetical protein
MLDDVAVYLTLAPLAASLALGALVLVFWLNGRRPEPVRVRVRHRR